MLRSKTLIVISALALVLQACGGGATDSVTDPPDTTAPSSPTDIVPKPVSDSQIDLTWSPSTDDVGVVGYAIYRDGVRVGTSTTTDYSDAGLTPGTTYVYTLRASDASGNVSEPSAAATGITNPDTIAPSTPTGVVAAVSSGSEITLTWNASSDNISVIGYRVLRDDVEVGSPISNTFFDTGLSVATVYRYTVSAVDDAGNESVPSAPAIGIIPDKISPSAPGQPAAVIGTNSISLSWTASTDNAGVSSYVVYRNGMQIATPTGATYTDTTASVVTSYSYTVSARDAAGNESAPSPATSATIPDTTAPSVPGQPAAVIGTNSISLSWTASTDNVGVSNYVVYRNGMQIATPTGTAYTDTNASVVTPYSYTVSARDAAGNGSGASPATSATIPDSAAPSVPGQPAAAIGTNSISLNWTASTDNVGVSSYVVYRNGVSIATPAGATYTDTTASVVTPYSYTVSARDATGNESAPSPATSATIPDTTAPTVPGQPAAVIGTNSIGLSWSAPTDNVGVSSYVVYRDGVQIATPAGTAFTDTTASVVTSYSYTVSARDAAGNESAKSPAANATIPDGTAPSVPGQPAAAIGTNSISLSWTASTDNVGVSSYVVYRNGTQIATPTGATYTDTTASVVTPYSYTVSARDATGNESAPSPATSATIPDKISPSAPGQPAAVIGTNSIGLSWTASTDNVGVSSYVVYRNGMQIATPTGATYTDTTASVVTPYSYTVSARDAAGNESAPSPATSATIPDTTAPSAPGQPAAVIGTNSIGLSWSAPTDNVGVSSYVVYRDGVPIAILTNTSSFSDTAVSVAKRHTYTVRARDAAGNESAPSPVASATIPDTTAPSVPGQPAAVIGTNSIGLSWTASTDDVGVAEYVVRRDGMHIATVTSTAYSNSGLNAATPYSYTVSARDATGNESAPSPATSATIPDKISPSAPGQPAAIIGTNSIGLSWTASTDNVGVSSYVVYRNDIQIATPTGTAYTDTHASVVTPYSYTVSARDAAGNESARSPAASATIPDTTAPTVPDGLSATVTSTDSIVLVWNPSLDDVLVTSYRIFRNGIEATAPKTATVFIDTGLNPGTTYSYTVLALDAAGNASSVSATVHATTQVPPDAAVLRWDPVPDPNNILGGYRIYYGTAPDLCFRPHDPGITVGNKTTYTVTGLSSGVRYYFAVTAYDTSGYESACSNEVFKNLP